MTIDIYIHFLIRITYYALRYFLFSWCFIS